MSVTAQSGIFSFGGQPGGAKGTVASTFYKHRASDIDLGVVSDDRLGPPEVGGTPIPTIPYRAGVMVAGGALMNPRLENTLGWLLFGAMGAVVSTTNKDCTGTEGATVTGMYRHEFRYSTTDNGYVPYMSMRKFIPGTNTTTSFGETFRDCKIVSLTMALPNDGLIASRVDAIGRYVSFTNGTTATAWSYGNTLFEDYQSIPIGVVTAGYLQVPTYSATELPIVAATITLTNAPLDIRQERVYGDPYLQDITVVGRSITADFVVKWEDPYLYQSIITGATTGTTSTEWRAQPWVGSFDVMSYAAQNATGTTAPWQCRVYVPAMMFQVAGGIRLAGNQSVAMRLTGTGVASTSSTIYGTVYLGNTITSYTWPA
jgi:hypothetical protein